MASQSAICNRALEMLGQAPLVSISDNTAQAKAMKRVYDDSRRALLEDHPWNFAKKRAAIPASATAPAWGFTTGYPLPADYLRLLEIKDEPTFEIEADPSGAQWIATNAAAPLYIIYIYDVVDTGRYPPSFVEAFASKLAFDTVEDFSNSNTKKDTIANVFATNLSKAKRINGLQRQARGFRVFSFLGSRWNGSVQNWPPYGDISEPR